MEKKCENCAFCTPKPEQMNFLPNDFICGSSRSKWHGYCPVNGVCEHYTEPTGKTVEEVLKEDVQAKKVIEGILSIMSQMRNNNDLTDEFMKRDAAVLKDYGVKDNE